MLKFIKICDYFFDVSMYCVMKNLCYREFFSLCMKEMDNRKNSFLIKTHEDCFIACCMDFLKTSVKISGLEKLNGIKVWVFFEKNI